MITENVVVREDDPRNAELQRNGWRVMARSWGAQLDAMDVDNEQLERLLARASALGVVRELDAQDVPAILRLDAATAGDYPGGVATTHSPLDQERATVGPNRRGFGVIIPGEASIAMTFVDVDGTEAETDFTVVAARWRGRGLGTAVKAASVLTLLGESVDRFRTGGSADNTASVTAESRIGYAVDEF